MLLRRAVHGTFAGCWHRRLRLPVCLIGDLVLRVRAQRHRFADQIRGVRRDDAVAHAEIHDLIDVLFVLTIQPNLIEQVADLARGPQAWNETSTAT